MDNNKKLQMFIDAVNAETDDKMNGILAEAENMKKAILAEAESFCADESGRKEFCEKSENDHVRNVSAAELEMKKSVIRHRDELADKVFGAVEERLLEFRNDPKYVNLLIKNLLLMHVSDGAEIFLSPDDMKYAETLKKAIPQCKAKFSPDENIRLGGLSVYNAEKGIVLDKTFDSAVGEQKRAFASANAFAE